MSSHRLHVKNRKNGKFLALVCFDVFCRDIYQLHIFAPKERQLQTSINIFAKESSRSDWGSNPRPTATPPSYDWGNFEIFCLGT
jgi:hypothetical protein